MFEAKEIIYQNNDWITLVLLVVFTLLTISRVLFKDRLFHGNTFFLSKKYLSIYYTKEKGKILSLYQSLLFVVRLLVLSLMFYLIYRYYQDNVSTNGFRSYLIIILGLGCYIIIIRLIGQLLAYLFDFKNEYGKINYDKVNYFNNLILWLLPFLIFSIYLTKYEDLLLKISFLIFVGLLILRYSLVLLNNKKFIFNNLFYFILYLCALEIAPLIIILKSTI